MRVRVRRLGREEGGEEEGEVTRGKCKEECVVG